MNRPYTLTAFPLFWGGARSDWLLGTTLRAPTEDVDSVVDDVPVRRTGVPAPTRQARRPWVCGYCAAQGQAIERISVLLADRVIALSAGERDQLLRAAWPTASVVDGPVARMVEARPAP